MNKIYISPTDRYRIVEKYKVSMAMISQALTFQRHSNTARSIRVYAMNFLDSAQLVER